MSSPAPAAPEKGGGNPSRRFKVILGLLVLASLLATIVIAALLVDVAKKQTEAKDTYTKVVDITDTTVDPAVWGQNFPIQYAMYKKTSEMESTTWGLNVVNRKATADDPRTQVALEKIERDPMLKKLWAGYAFAVDYRQARGHEYMLEDQRLTKRTKDFPQPGTCINCHASTYVVFKELGNGDQFKGFDKVNHMKYQDATKLFDHPISCIDCHDPKTMALRVTKPAFIRGIAALKASQGVKDYDVNRDATPNEMRSFVCGQCHVEYYFKGDAKTLTFPWSQGLNIDNEYTVESSHVDWTHATTKGKMLKAQHPDFETWSQGIHAKAGVTCADCHMPYKRVGATKVSDHQVRSPLLNINASCQTCHKASETEMKDRVLTIQNNYRTELGKAYVAVGALIDDLTAAEKNHTATADQILAAQEYQRKAGFYLDYTASENSTGFHAPEYSLRILSDSINASRQGQLILKGVKTDPAPIPVGNIDENTDKPKVASASATPAAIPSATATPSR